MVMHLIMYPSYLRKHIIINYNKNYRLFYTEELIEHLDEEVI